MDITVAKPDIKCTVFEDNKGAKELVKVHKSRPRTKHIAVKYHHFRQAVKDKIFHITRIDTKDQRADIFTKVLPCQSFEALKQTIMRWMIVLTKKHIHPDQSPSIFCNIAMKWE
eukprot:11360209-Ditylum_brightwellii.AAC.1